MTATLCNMLIVTTETMPRVCVLPKGHQPPCVPYGASPSMILYAGAVFAQGAGARTEQPTPGPEWTCAHCDGVNLGLRTRCRFCHRPAGARTGDEGMRRPPERGTFTGSGDASYGRIDASVNVGGGVSVLVYEPIPGTTPPRFETAAHGLGASAARALAAKLVELADYCDFDPLAPGSVPSAVDLVVDPASGTRADSRSLPLSRSAGSTSAAVPERLREETTEETAAEAEAMLRRHMAMYDWSKREAAAINDFILTVRWGVQEDLDAVRAAAPASPDCAICGSPAGGPGGVFTAGPMTGAPCDDASHTQAPALPVPGEEEAQAARVISGLVHEVRRGINSTGHPLSDAECRAAVAALDDLAALAALPSSRPASGRDDEANGGGNG